MVVLGTIAILVMLLMPKGVWGEIARRWEIRLFPTQRVLSRSSCRSNFAN
jgi:branched-chain amino acid transport system permease protein